MASIVEIVGPSGVGKSYIYNQLRDAWNKNDKWAVYHDFRYERKSRNSFSRPEIIYEYLYNILNKVKYISYKPSGGEQLDHMRSEEHTSELQSRGQLVCRLLLEKK